MTTFDRRAVMDILSSLVTPGIKLTALADELGAREHEYSALRAMLLELVEEGVAQVLPGGAFALAPQGRTADPRAKRGRKPTAPPPQPQQPRRGGKPTLPWKQAQRAAAAPPPPPPAPLPPRHATPPPTFAEPSIVGRITVHPAGYGFVATDDGGTVFVPAKYRGLSLDGDRVQVDTWPGVRGTEGRVADVLARGRARLTGILRRVGRVVYLEPDDPRISADYGRVTLDEAQGGKDGDAIVVEITRYPDAIRRELAGKLLKVLGDPEDPRTEIEKILACAVIPLEFPDAAIAQAVATSSELGPADLADRIDLRDRRFATIDPETARDFDDALCIEDGPHGGPRVWVAVADVSHYVRWGDALDREAAIRGVSVYLPDRVISMLPHQLSAGICSLNPMVDRCAMVVRLDFSPDGEIVDTFYAAAAIRSKGRLDYPGVAAALGGDFRGRREQYREWLGELTRLDALARILRGKRRARGALEIEIGEPKVVLDADDPLLVRDVVRAKGDPAVKRAYELVEEFMIAANEAVGRFFRLRGVTSVWRVHAPPKQERVELLAQLLESYGITIDVEEARTPLGMKKVLDEINAKPSASALGFLVLRTLSQAVWDTVPTGHFGLASGDYLHFTSPIRRYPDLLVHRLLKHHLHKDGHASGGGYAAPPPTTEELTALAHASSGHERRAMEAEREAVGMYRAYLMRDQVGEQFAGTVSAVTSFGAFVEIEEPFVEGLIKLDSLGQRADGGPRDDKRGVAEPWDYDAVHMRLSGRKTGRSIQLGDKVTVEINNVSVVRRRIDFTLIAGVPGERAPVVQTAPRVPFAKKKVAAREVERAQRPERAAVPRKTGDGKIRFGVSHRGIASSKPKSRGPASKPKKR